MTHRQITPSVLYFGTPVVVVSSLNADGTTNLAPISSLWSLGGVLVLGLGANGHTVANLRRRPELVINYCWDHQWAAVESLALLTGADPVPDGKPDGCQFEPDKFRVAGWSAAPSHSVGSLGVAEAGACVEAIVTDLYTTEDIVVVHARSVSVHADPEIVIDGTSHIDPTRWRPLIYNFRHYFALGERRGIAHGATSR